MIADLPPLYTHIQVEEIDRKKHSFLKTINLSSTIPSIGFLKLVDRSLSLENKVLKSIQQNSDFVRIPITEIAKVNAIALANHLDALEICPRVMQPTNEGGFIFEFNFDGAYYAIEIDEDGDIGMLKRPLGEESVFIDLSLEEATSYFENNVGANV